MKIQVLTNADSVAQAAAKFIAAEARASVAARGRFIVAVSGGRTPWQMLRALANEEVPWKNVHVVQGSDSNRTRWSRLRSSNWAGSELIGR